MGTAKGQRKNAAGAQRRALVVFAALFVALFAIFAVAQGIGSPSVPEGDVAIVEDAPGDSGAISKAEFNRSLVQLASEGAGKKPPKPGSDKFEELKDQAMEEVINAVWIEGEAAELGIEATPKQIADELDQIKQQNFPTEKAFKEFLEKSKFTREDVDRRVRLQIFSNQIQQQISNIQVTPSNAEIEQFYEAAKDTQFTQPATRDVRVVTNKDAAKLAKAKAALLKDDSEKSWKAVAKKFSEETLSKETGGLQAGVTEESGRFPEEVEEMLFTAKTGVVLGPIETAQGSYIVEVVKTTPVKVQTLGDVRAQISSQLTQQRQQEVFTEFVTDFQSKWRSRTFCADGYEIPLCANYTSDGRPEGAPPACYEANPKTQEPLECPAPVAQLAPAMPGSVNLMTPQGNRLPQRPRPVGLEESETPGANLEELIPGATGAPGG